MSDIDPTKVPWPQSIFSSISDSETGYGRFVREYLDGLMHPDKATEIRSLDRSHLIKLVGATLNPILMETAAALFAIDLGMTLDSANGKGRHGIDVVACCNHRARPGDVIRRLEAMGLSISDAAKEALRKDGTIAFQCKAYHQSAEVGDQERVDPSSTAKRLVYFRYIDESDPNHAQNAISIQRVLRAVSEGSEFPHLRDWLDRMCSVVRREKPAR